MNCLQEEIRVFLINPSSTLSNAIREAQSLSKKKKQLTNFFFNRIIVTISPDSNPLGIEKAYMEAINKRSVERIGP